MIVIVDYGMGNLRSVAKAVEALEAEVRVSSLPKDIEQADKLILPGVGAFPAAMRELWDRKLVEPIAAALRSGRPYLGICLGLQLLFERSEEGGGAPGFGLLPGFVKRLPSANGLKVPHMGWNQIARARRACPLLEGIPDGSYFYFVHSYYGDPTTYADVTLETDYGTRFASMVWRDNIFATQFHPEKSQALGLRLLRNFIAL